MHDLKYTEPHKSAFLALELIFEELEEACYKDGGPESYNREYRNQLKKDGLWEEEMANWTPPAPEEALYLTGYIEGLRKASALCNTAIRRTDDRMCNEWHQFKLRNPHSYY